MRIHGDTAVLTAALAHPDGLLDGRGDEAGEEEGAEGVDMEGDKALTNGRVSDAGRVGDAGEGGGRVGGRVPSDAEEDGERKERVDVDDAVEGHYVDACIELPA